MVIRQVRAPHTGAGSTMPIESGKGVRARRIHWRRRIPSVESPIIRKRHEKDNYCDQPNCNLSEPHFDLNPG